MPAINLSVWDETGFLNHPIALPLDSLLLHGVSARPCFWVRARPCKHARCHACPWDGLKAGLGLTPRNNRLSNGRAMMHVKNWIVKPHLLLLCNFFSNHLIWFSLGIVTSIQLKSFVLKLLCLIMDHCCGSWLDLVRKLIYQKKLYGKVLFFNLVLASISCASCWKIPNCYIIYNMSELRPCGVADRCRLPCHSRVRSSVKKFGRVQQSYGLLITLNSSIISEYITAG